MITITAWSVTCRCVESARVNGAICHGKIVVKWLANKFDIGRYFQPDHSGQNAVCAKSVKRTILLWNLCDEDSYPILLLYSITMYVYIYSNPDALFLDWQADERLFDRITQIWCSRHLVMPGFCEDGAFWRLHVTEKLESRKKTRGNLIFALNEGKTSIRIVVTILYTPIVLNGLHTTASSLIIAVLAR